MSSLLNRANAAAGTTAPAAPPAGGSFLSSPPAAPAGPTPEQIAAEQARLAEEERQARLRAIVPHGFMDTCAAVRSYNRGFPLLKGAAAQAFAAAGGQSVAPDFVYPGTGEIHYVQLDQAEHMIKLASDMAANYGPAPTNTPTTVINPLAPNAPVSDPRLAADGGTPVTTDTSLNANVNVPPGPSPEAIATAAKMGIDTANVTVTEETTPKAKTPRKAKAKEEVLADAGASMQTTAPQLHLYVDVVSNFPTVSLNDWAQEMADKLAKSFGAIDIQCAPEDSPLGYEKWRGALRAFIRDEKASPLPEGSAFSIDTRYSAVMTTIAEGLAIRIRMAGGKLTRSVR